MLKNLENNGTEEIGLVPPTPDRQLACPVARDWFNWTQAFARKCTPNLLGGSSDQRLVSMMNDVNERN